MTLPTKWTNKTLRDLATINYGRDPSAILDDAGEYPVYGTSGSERQGTGYHYEGESIILGRKGSIDRVHFAEGRFWVIDTAYFLNDFDDTAPKWLYYLLCSIDLRALNEATGVPSLARDLLYKISMPTPPPNEQAKIAEVLSTVDRAIEQTEALIAKQQRIKRGLMHDLLTRGIDEHGNLRSESTHEFKDSPLGRVSAEWDTLPLGELAAVDRGKFIHRPRNDPRFYGGDFPFVQTGDVTSRTGRVVNSYSQTLNHRGTLVSKSFPAGTIAVTIAANIADTAILGLPMYFPDSVVGAIVKRPHCIRFIELMIRRWKPILERRAPQSAQKNINLETLRPLAIPTPPPEEQERIGALYDSVDTVQEMTESLLRKLCSLKTGLMQDLLTGKVRVTPLLEQGERATA